MSTTGSDVSGARKMSAPEGRDASPAPGWTKVQPGSTCSASEQVEPLVLVHLGEKVRPETKTWLVNIIGASEKDGGAALLAHPGEDSSDDIIVVSAPRCTLLRTTEELGLCKTTRNGDMVAFSYHNRDNFRNSDDMQVFLTLAERQYIVKYELEGLRAQRDLRIPGLPDSLTLQNRDNIWLKLQQAGVIVDMHPLHHHEQLKKLSKSWYSGNQLAQPLDAVHAYFGSTIAFYFSFLDFYTWALLPPAILSLATTFFIDGVQYEVVDSLSNVTSEENDSPSLSGHIIVALFSILWSTVFMELWKRRSASLSCQWGSLRLAERFAEPRPGFHGDLGVNPVTDRIEPLFPDWQRKLRITLVSIPVVGLFVGLVLLGMFGFYWGEDQVQQLQEDGASLLSQALLYLPSVVHIVYANILANVYNMVALSLTEYENHREEWAYQNHLTAKVVVFTFFNFFTVLFHIAFYKQDLPLLRKRLASLLIISQLVNQVTEVVIPYLVDRLLMAPKRKEKEDDPQEDKLKNQCKLPAFPGLFQEYIELLVQFGYLSFFSCVYPLTAVLLLINNLTEIRSDAYKICKLYRKPFSAPVAGMGVWQIAFEVLSFVSVASNCWLLLLSPRVRAYCLERGISSRDLLLLAVLAEHVLIIIKMVLVFLIPDEPDWVKKKRDHIEFTSMQALGQQKL